MSILDTVLVLEEIGKVCYVTAMGAPEEIKRKILPRVATGEAILAICMTEPDAGTDVPNYKTNCTIKVRPRHPARRQDADLACRHRRNVCCIHPR